MTEIETEAGTQRQKEMEGEREPQIYTQVEACRRRSEPSLADGDRRIEK